MTPPAKWKNSWTVHSSPDCRVCAWSTAAAWASCAKPCASFYRSIRTWIRSPNLRKTKAVREQRWWSQGCNTAPRNCHSEERSDEESAFRVVLQLQLPHFARHDNSPGNRLRNSLSPTLQPWMLCTPLPLAACDRPPEQYWSFRWAKFHRNRSDKSCHRWYQRYPQLLRL